MNPVASIQTFVEKHSRRETSGKPLVVFDCDGTVIDGDVGEAMFYYQIENFLFRQSPADVWPDHPQRKELDTLFGTLQGMTQEERSNNPLFQRFIRMVISWYFSQLEERKTDKACADIVRLMAGFTPAEARAMGETILDFELASPRKRTILGGVTRPLGIRFIREALSFLQMFQEGGFHILAISGSNQWVVEAVFSRLGLHGGDVYGIDLTAENGILTRIVKEPIPVSGGKVECIRRTVGKQPVMVLSDSSYDAPLFQYSSDLRVLINSRYETSDRFFAEAGFTRDGTWLVIEQPHMMESVEWQMHKL